MVEGARLESVYRGDSIVGSNPTVSANKSKRINVMARYRAKNPRLRGVLLFTTEPWRLPKRLKSVSDQLLSLFTRTITENVRLERIHIFQYFDDLCRPNFLDAILVGGVREKFRLRS